VTRKLLVFLLAAGACSGPDTSTVRGRVVRHDGSPVGGAQVILGGSQATSGSDGAFTVSGLAPGTAVLARVLVAGEREHAAPVAIVNGETRVVIRSPAPPGTADLWIGGDVMFARRYVDLDADGDDADALVHPDDPATGVLAVMRHIGPLLRDADLSMINLETAVTDAGMIHPRKPYTLRSEPAVLGALRETGVGLLGLGNNHVFDYGEDGLRRMLDLVDEAGLPRVGAGKSWDEAVTPHIATVNGLKVAVLAATSITGRPYTAEAGGDALEGDDLPPYYTADPDHEHGRPKPGATRLTSENLLEGIRRADAAGADVKVLVVHGGTQYSRTESPFVRRMAHLAIDHGVHLVVGHHPHVAQGIEVYRGVPIVYSLGNLAFDQQFPETFPGLILEARVQRGGVIEAAVRPIYLDEFSPRALAGDDAVRVLRDVAAMSAALGATLEIDAAAGRAVIREGAMPAESTAELAAPLLAGRTLPQPLPLADGALFLTGVDAPGHLVDLGRPLLVNASFLDGCADDGDAAAGWQIVGREKRIVRVDGAPAELRLLRGGVSAEDSTVRSMGRLTVQAGTRLSLVGQWRRDADAGRAVARIVLYADRAAGSVPVAVAEARGATTDWRPFSFDLVVPPAARFAQVQLAHAPPTHGERGEVAFTGVDLLSWSGPVAAGDIAASGASYLALVGGDGEARATLRLARSPRPATPAVVEEELP
jgi:poly-gamma-glutamate capsule biosynthesis protein CapA/YwtB (metallophosphatase superfamily)